MSGQARTSLGDNPQGDRGGRSESALSRRAPDSDGRCSLVSNPLGWCLERDPGWLLLSVWAVGVLIVAWSYLLGLGWFDVEFRFEFENRNRSEPRIAGIGYIQQLNYGPWHFLPFLCPAIYLLAAL